MLRQAIFLLFFITITGVNAAQGEWNYQEAEPQAYTSTDRYVIAVGEEVFPIRRGPSWFVPDNLDAGKISISVMEILAQRGINLTGKPSVKVQRKGEKWLINNKFVLDTGDQKLRVYRLEVVQAYDIFQALTEGKEVRLKMALIVGGILEWRGDRQRVNNNLYFIDSTFVAPVSFSHIRFSGNVLFTRTHLFEGLFRDAEFYNFFSFRGASVSRNVRFNDVQFKSAEFNRLYFASNAVFTKVSFGEAVDFKQSRFSQISFQEHNNVITQELDFSGAYFEKDLSFAGFKFQNGAKFKNTTFKGFANFGKAQFREAEFSDANFGGNLSFEGTSCDGNAYFRNADFTGVANFKGAQIDEADFFGVRFGGDVNFEGITFKKGAKFRNASFASVANFKGAQFGEADFFGVQFNKHTDFSDTKFTGEGNFSSTTFSDNADFTAGTFSSQARFTFAKFSNKESDVSFQGTRFEDKADFSYARINKIDFSPYTPRLGNALFIIDYETHHQALNDGMLTDQAKKRIDEYFKLSDNTEITVMEQSNIWLIDDVENQLVFHVNKESLKEENRIEDKLVFNVRSKNTLVNKLSLIGTHYELMNIDSRSINRFVFDEAAFQRFLKNQREIGRQPFEYENAVLAFKRFQRSQKWFLTRWLETFLFDWTTQYGTAKIPWGLVIYAAACIFFFAGLYRLSPNFMMFVKSDGSVDESRNDPGLLEIFWFSGNTFIPAIEFLNASSWRPKYDAIFPGGFIRYATIATIERILGWAMVPALLSYI